MDSKGFLLKNSRGKKVLFLFVLTNIVYMAMLMVTIPKVIGHTDGLRILDMMPMGYDLEYVKQLFETLGPEGRNSYLFYQLPLDMVYPFLFGWSYCLLLAYFLRKLNKLHCPLIYCCLLPVLAAIADYAENMGILNLLVDYPEISDTAVIVTSMSTLLKSVTTTVYFLVLISIFIWWIFRILSYRTHSR